MSRPDFLFSLDKFKGKALQDSLDEIERLAFVRNYSINVVNPRFGAIALDNEPNRVNVRTNREAIITSFTIG